MDVFTGISVMLDQVDALDMAFFHEPLGPTENPVRVINSFVGGRPFRPMADEVGKICGVALVHEGAKATVIGTETSVALWLEHWPKVKTKDEVAVRELRSPRITPRATREGREARVAPLRVAHRLSGMFFEFRVCVGDPEHTGATEVQLRKSVGKRKIGGIALAASQTSG
jgi:hypothetical protein